jgi:glycosyltransferase involved in cell wall biosynthesis
MASLHIGTISYDWYPFEPRALRQAEAAADAGHQVDVICLRQPNAKSYEVRNGVHIYRVPMSRGFGRSLPVTILGWCWFLLLAAVTVTWLHLKRPYNVIHVHNMPDFLVFSTFFPKLLGAKIILDVQDISPELMAGKANGRIRAIVVPLAKLQERISTTFADHVVTAGWPFEKLLLQRGVPEEKLTVIINSADPKAFPTSLQGPILTETPNASRPFILMYYGTVAERLGIDTAVRALALALRIVPHLRLDIKGRGEHLFKVKQLTEELGLSDHVVFLESSPYNEVVNFIVQGDVGVIPYQCDGFTDLLLPTKAYELAWMHRPIIASDTPAIRSMFRPESIALCVPSSPESFAEAIIDLYNHPEKRASMMANAAEDYEAYRWEFMTERYQHLLASLCGKQGEEQHPPVEQIPLVGS